MSGLCVEMCYVNAVHLPLVCVFCFEWPGVFGKCGPSVSTWTEDRGDRRRNGLSRPLTAEHLWRYVWWCYCVVQRFGDNQGRQLCVCVCVCVGLISPLRQTYLFHFPQTGLITHPPTETGGLWRRNVGMVQWEDGSLSQHLPMCVMLHNTSMLSNKPCWF